MQCGFRCVFANKMSCKTMVKSHRELGKLTRLFVTPQLRSSLLIHSRPEQSSHFRAVTLSRFKKLILTQQESATTLSSLLRTPCLRAIVAWRMLASNMRTDGVAGILFVLLVHTNCLTETSACIAKSPAMDSPLSSFLLLTSLGVIQILKTMP